MFDIEEEIKKLPQKPGVYIMHDKNDKIIYVGKAISLKRRVTSYFRKTKKTQRILNMVALIDHFEYIVCDNEAEALILECNLIKKNMPKFNVLLKDGKTYPYIKVNVKDNYPDVYITRKIINDGAKYFGPYANPGAAKETVDFIKSKFKIRQCKNFKYKDRACLNYHIKKCSAPCMGYISKEDYREQINQIIEILDGKTDKVEKDLKKKMDEASARMEYEKAGLLRDELMAVESISQKQKVSNISENDIDVIGIARSGDENSIKEPDTEDLISSYGKICIEIFYVRNSKLVGRDNFFFNGLADEEDKEILSEFIKQYYTGRTFFPNKIMIREDIYDKDLLENWLSQMANRKVEIKIPQKGEKAKLVEMAERNAKITLDNKEKSNKNIVLEIQETLKLNKLPRKIEAYDNSNISGEFIVSAMCVMIDGVIKKNLSRKFKIKTVFGQDDPRCMEEVVTRRLRHSIKLNENGDVMLTEGIIMEQEDISQMQESINKLSPSVKEKYGEGNGFGRLPDLILADGGITQIRAIKKAIANIENETGVKLDIQVFGMVKNDKHQTRALMDENRNEIKISEEIFNLITNFQNTVHDTAIGYHKFLRDKSMTKSSLDEIKGIGDMRKIALLKKFESVDKIASASIEEIAEIEGINEDLARKIKTELNKK